MADKARHAFGSSQNLEAALSAGTIDAYDILFLDGDTDPKVGWVDKDGNPVVVDTEKVTVVEGETLPDTGVVGKIYIFGEDGYFWDGTEFVSLSKSADLSALEAEIATKVDEATVDAKIETAINNATTTEIVEF